MTGDKLKQHIYHPNSPEQMQRRKPLKKRKASEHAEVLWPKQIEKDYENQNRNPSPKAQPVQKPQALFMFHWNPS